MTRAISLRRMLALALLAAVTGPYVRGIVDGARADAHGCDDEVCRCTHGRPATPEGPAPCHGGARAPASECRMNARCNHEFPAFPAAQRPALVGETQSLTCEYVPAGRPLTPRGSARAGFSRIDSPPPRLT